MPTNKNRSILTAFSIIAALLILGLASNPLMTNAMATQAGEGEQGEGEQGEGEQGEGEQGEGDLGITAPPGTDITIEPEDGEPTPTPETAARTAPSPMTPFG